jgi:anti-sigma factor RsiW
MKMAHVTESLSAYLDGQLKPAEREAVDAHLASCDDCRRRLAALQKTVKVMRMAEPVRAPEGFRAAVRARIEELGAPARRLPLTWSWRTAATAAAVLVVALFSVNLLREQFPQLAGRGDQVQTIESPAVTRAIPAPRASSPEVAPAPMLGAPDRVAQSPVITALRQVIRSAHLLLEVEKLDEAAARLMRIAEAAGGFVADSSYAQMGASPEGTFSLRVPAARFADVLAQVEGLGRVLQRRVSGQDVTEEFVDLQARIRNLERHEQRLLTFVDRATKVSDLLAIEQDLARVRGEIERLTGRMRFLENRVELASIDVTLREKTQPAGGLWDVGRLLAKMRTAFLATLRQMLGAVEAIAVALSALVPVVILAGAGWLVVRRIRARA